MEFRKKNLRKVVLGCTCAGIIAAVNTVCLAEGKAVINAISDTKTGAVIVSGRAYEQSAVNYTLLILKSSVTHESLTDENFNDYVECYIGGTTEADGSFFVSCLPKTEWSDAPQQIVFTTGEKSTAMFLYITAEDEATVVSTMKNASESEIGKILSGESLISGKKFSELTGIDMTVYNSLSDKSGVISAVADGSFTTVTELAELLLSAQSFYENHENLLKNIKKATDEELLVLLGDNSEYLDLKLDEQWGYKYLEKLYNSGDKAPLSELYKKIRQADSLDAISESFREWEMLTALNFAAWQDVYSILDAFSDEFKITDLNAVNKLSDAKRARVLQDMASFEFKDIKTISVKLSEYIKNNSAASQSGGSGGGGGGGGGGGNAAKPAVGIGAAASNPVPAAPETEPKKTVEFSDITGSHWAKAAVEDLCAKGVINGYPDGSFKPDAPVKREEFIKMTVMALGFYKSDSECSFADVATDAWYYKYIASAFGVGLTKGQGETFGIGQNITRQEMATMMWRAATVLEKTLGDGMQFSDSDSIDDFAKDAVFALGGSVISGDESGNFNPKADATRAQAAQMLYKLMRIK